MASILYKINRTATILAVMYLAQVTIAERLDWLNDQLLQSNLKPKNAQECVDKAKDLLEKSSGANITSHEREDIQNLVDLSKLGDECDRNSLQLVETFQYELGHRVVWREGHPHPEVRLVDLVVHHFLVENAKACMKKLPETVRKGLSHSFEPKLRLFEHLVSQFAAWKAERLVGDYHKLSPEEKFEEKLHQLSSSIWVKDEGKELLSLMKTLTRDSEKDISLLNSGTGTVQLDDIDEMFMRQTIGDNCLTYKYVKVTFKIANYSAKVLADFYDPALEVTVYNSWLANQFCSLPGSVMRRYVSTLYRELN